QIQLLQKINEVDADTLVTAILAELNHLSTNLDQATQSWRTGDMEKLDQLQSRKVRTQAPHLYRELVVNRNKAWLPQLKDMLETGETEYVLVNAIHLTGPDNLLQMLKAEG